MSVIKLEVDSTTAVGTLSNTADYVGHFTASIADTTTGQEFDGEIALDENIDGDWVQSDSFTSSGIFPGFNAIAGTYRFRLVTAPSTGITGKAVLRGYDKPTNIPY